MDNKIIIVILVFVALVLIGTSFLVIWVLNTLGVANCPFNFWTWLAAFVMLLIFGATSQTQVNFKK